MMIILMINMNVIHNIVQRVLSNMIFRPKALNSLTTVFDISFLFVIPHKAGDMLPIATSSKMRRTVEFLNFSMQLTVSPPLLLAKF